MLGYQLTGSDQNRCASIEVRRVNLSYVRCISFSIAVLAAQLYRYTLLARDLFDSPPSVAAEI